MAWSRPVLLTTSVSQSEKNDIVTSRLENLLSATSTTGKSLLTKEIKSLVMYRNFKVPVRHFLCPSHRV